MTCRQFHERSEHVEFDPASLSPEMLYHVSVCANCKALVEERSELGMELRHVRDSAPGISASLDAAILAAFRKQTALPDASSSANRFHRRIPPVAVLSCSAALLAAAVIAALVLPIRRAGPRLVPHGTVAPIISSELQKPTRSEPAQRGFKPSRVAFRPKLYQRDHVRPPTSEAHSQLPSGFTSLMYCDQLSCAGAMEIVRVPLSRSMVALTGPTDASETVFADVLVGPDGIARGIRIAQ